ncbi:hypothetical protein [Methylomagnum ishizawai]|uniref:hypothetical protein n=1 Tax=Methylomagnum ishizawai TaxID=1760988 RepID=UPI001C336355|nr:hypothetical protein [Methylomagnum ishizawai]BBL76831.1 hypothetical protein MishRS11D_39290 [Methylomagnum ishizawai]
MSRADLLRLSPEALAQATNLGLVKRALRELEGGNRPSLVLDAANTLTATFGDGVATVWEAEQPIQHSRCSCGAQGVCRHRLIAALAYRADAEQAPPPLESPAKVDDATLARLIPARALNAAEVLKAAGMEVELRHPGSGEPCPTARLPMATVRFWGGAAIEAARCDCVAAACCEHVALAVWAFREAAESEPEAPAARVRWAGAAAQGGIDPALFHDLVDSLLRHGVRLGLAPHREALTNALEAAETGGAVWLGLLLGELEAWIAAYAQRNARYDRAEGVRLVAELALRLAAGGQPDRARSALGIGEPAETELDRLRLVSLGARIDRDGDLRRVRLVMADGDTGTHFVLVHAWQAAGDEAGALAAQRLAPGVKLLPLAGGQLLSRQAKRRADGTLTLAKSRSSQNSLLPQAGDWSGLGRPLCFERVADLREEKALRPVPHLLPRHAAAGFAVLRVAGVEALFYAPHQQALLAVVRDADGESVILRREHAAHTPHALDAMAGALTGRFGAPTHVAGAVSWRQGRAWFEPWAFACGRMLALDLEPACGALAAVPTATAGEPETGELDRFLGELEAHLATLLHHGLAELGGDWVGRSRGLAEALRGRSLTALAIQWETVIDAVRSGRVRPGDGGPAAHWLRLSGLLALHREAAGLGS